MRRITMSPRRTVDGPWATSDLGFERPRRRFHWAFLLLMIGSGLAGLILAILAEIYLI